MLMPLLQSAMMIASLGITVDVGWLPVGDQNEQNSVQVHADDSVDLRSDGERSVGVLSPVQEVPGDCDAVMVGLIAEEAAAQGITVAVHDAKTGEPLGYWQNPIRLEGPTSLLAALNLTRPSREIRVFVGSDRVASSAHFSVESITPLRRAESYDAELYGLKIDGDRFKSFGQTFRARAKDFVGISFKVRFSPGEAGVPQPDLEASLYEWTGDPQTTRAGEPLATSRILGRLIPSTTKINGIELPLQLQAQLNPGTQYFVEVTEAATTPAAEDQARAPRLVCWGAPDGFDHGEAYQDDRATGWDAACNIYYLAQ